VEAGHLVVGSRGAGDQVTLPPNVEEHWKEATLSPDLEEQEDATLSPDLEEQEGASHQVAEARGAPREGGAPSSHQVARARGPPGQAGRPGGAGHQSSRAPSTHRTFRTFVGVVSPLQEYRVRHHPSKIKDTYWRLLQAENGPRAGKFLVPGHLAVSFTRNRSE
jgi:hypothetical protein